MVCFVHRKGDKIQIFKRLLAGEMNVKLRKTQYSRKKLKNSRKKLKTQGKNSNFRHIHMLAMRKRWPNCKPELQTLDIATSTTLTEASRYIQ